MKESQLKKDLIQLFADTCKNFDVPRDNHEFNTNIDFETQRNIRKSLHSDEIRVPGMDKHFSRFDSDVSTYDIGFKFSHNPPIALGQTTANYRVKYGIMILIISYLFLNNYKKRKAYTKFCNELTKVDEKSWCSECDDFSKIITLKNKKRFIVHGTLFAEISFEEYDQLAQMYKASVKKYDEYMLTSRLNKNKK